MRRKLTLTEKSFKQQLTSERGKHAAMTKKLEAAQEKIEKLKDDIKVKINCYILLIHNVHKNLSVLNCIKGLQKLSTIYGTPCKLYFYLRRQPTGQYLPIVILLLLLFLFLG